MSNKSSLNYSSPIDDALQSQFSFDSGISLHHEQDIITREMIKENFTKKMGMYEESITDFNRMLEIEFNNVDRTVVDHKMAFIFFNLAANEIIDMKNTSSNLLIRKFYNINKEMGNIYLAHMYLDGIYIEKDLKNGFQIYSKVSHIALNCMAYCYEDGFGVEKHEKKALGLYLKCAEDGNLIAQ
ncbi:hypothetical protein Glove_357g25 [Diversispora epigaea]|uniref:Uncharacterized protein n=1 Tax=Diversispora epigaea TaxID=1348612 RepID=A0A397HF09_9GLOM|nr:hypothetical protein Glove_357g25 [Diversispora epigaea]